MKEIIPRCISTGMSYINIIKDRAGFEEKQQLTIGCKSFYLSSLHSWICFKQQCLLPRVDQKC